MSGPSKTIIPLNVMEEMKFRYDSELDITLKKLSEEYGYSVDVTFSRLKESGFEFHKKGINKLWRNKPEKMKQGMLPTIKSNGDYCYEDVRFTNRKSKRWARARKYLLPSMIKAQNYRCAICYKPIDEKSARLDHCHRTHKLRSLLCNSCNLGLGCFQDNTDFLKSAIAYLTPKKKRFCFTFKKIKG